MPEHPNVARIRKLFDAFGERNPAAIAAAIPEDAVWRFPGRRGQLAGEHRGRDAILRVIAKVMALSGGTFHLDLHDIVGGDDHVVVLFTGHAERDGKTLENPTCLRIAMRDGRPQEIDEFVWDLDHIEEFWS